MIEAILHRLGPLVLFVLLVAGLNGCTTMSLDDIGDPSPKIPVKLVRIASAVLFAAIGILAAFEYTPTEL